MTHTADHYDQQPEHRLGVMHLARIQTMCVAGAPPYLIIKELRRLADLLEYVDRPVSLTPAPGSHA